MGNTPIKVDYLNTFTDGKLTTPVVLQSVDTVMPIEAAIPADTYIKNANDEAFSGLVQAPIAISTDTVSGVSGVCSAVSVGTYTGESIYFKDDA